jgi:hypothetical protein
MRSVLCLGKSRKDLPLLARATVAEVVGIVIKPPGYYGVICRAVFLFLLSVNMSSAGLSKDLYHAGDVSVMEESLDSGSSAAERMLVKSMRAGDAAEKLDLMRSICRSSPADWIQQEALEILCAFHCINMNEDSLKFYSNRLAQISGTGFDCILYARESVCWSIQLGAFSTEGNAASAMRDTAAAGINGRVYYNGKLYLALLGCFASKREAREQAKAWKAKALIKDYRLRKIQDQE